MTTFRMIRPTLALGAIFALSACGGVGDALGVNKRPPDEFAVMAKAPLVVPPEYNLRPPRPGHPRPQELDPQALAVQALFPGRESVPPPSDGQQALLDAAGAKNARASVRSDVNADESTQVVSKGKLTKELLYGDIHTDETAGIDRLDPVRQSN